MLRTIFVFLALTTALSATACGGNSNKTTPTSAPPSSTPVRAAATAAPAATAVASGGGGSSNASASAGGNRGSLDLTGGVSGALSLNAVSCASAGGIIVAMTGSLSSASYGMNIQAQRPGTFTFRDGTTQGTVPLVQFSDQSPGAPAARTWSAGFQQAPGAGTMTINADNSGSIDADLNVAGSSTNAVHVKGSWKC